MHKAFNSNEITNIYIMENHSRIVIYKSISHFKKTVPQKTDFTVLRN